MQGGALLLRYYASHGQATANKPMPDWALLQLLENGAAYQHLVANCV